MPTVEVRLAALPAHVRTARLIATAVARRAGVEEALLDEVRLAVGEACSRAVGVHQRHAPDQPVLIALSDDNAAFTVVIEDFAAVDDDLAPGLTAGTALEQIDPHALAAPDVPDGNHLGAADLLPSGFGLAIVAGLVDDVDVTRGESGTRVTMRWKATGPPGTSAAG